MLLPKKFHLIVQRSAYGCYFSAFPTSVVLAIKWVRRVGATRWLHSNDCYGRLLESKDEPQPHTKLNPACSLTVYNLLVVGKNGEILPVEFPSNMQLENLLFVKSEHIYYQIFTLGTIQVLRQGPPPCVVGQRVARLGLNDGAKL